VGSNEVEPPRNADERYDLTRIVFKTLA